MTDHRNPVIERLGRRLRLGVVGGGPGSVIGEVHRTAARLDDRFEVVGGVLSSNPERSRAAGLALGWAPERAYRDADAMLAAETARADGVDVVAIMTPNDSHYPIACRWLDAGRDVICDKPLTTRLDDARDLVAKVRASGLVFCTTYNYSAYPMVRQARAMGRGRRRRRAAARPGGVRPRPVGVPAGGREAGLLALPLQPDGTVGDPGRHRNPRLPSAARGHRDGTADPRRGRRPGAARPDVRRHRRSAAPLRQRRTGNAVGHPDRGRRRTRAQIPGPRRPGRAVNGIRRIRPG